MTMFRGQTSVASLCIGLWVASLLWTAEAHAIAFGSLDFEGRAAFTAQGGSVRIDIDRIVNRSSTHTSGSLRIELWATDTPYGGGGISGTRTAAIRTVDINGLADQMPPDSYFYGITLNLPFVAPPPSRSFYTLILSEYDPNCTSADRFCIAAYIRFTGNVSDNPVTRDDFTISGTVRDESGAALQGVTAVLTGAGRRYEDTTDASGRYELTFDRVGMPDSIAFNLYRTGYVPSTVPLDLGNGTAVVLGTEILETLGPEIALVDVIPELHHLGDDNFGGAINSQFQMSSEGTAYSRQFSLTKAQMTASSAQIELMAKGLQCQNTLHVNGRLIGFLNSSPASGGFGSVTLSLTSTDGLVEGSNTITVRSVRNCNIPSDFDDFEFSNVVFRFQGVVTDAARASISVILNTLLLDDPPAPSLPRMCGGFQGLLCAAGEVCDYRDSSCRIFDQLGTCVPRPDACPAVYDPVCGCDGKTYSNDCARLAAGAVLRSEGPCP